MIGTMTRLECLLIHWLTEAEKTGKIEDIGSEGDDCLDYIAATSGRTVSIYVEGDKISINVWRTIADGDLIDRIKPIASFEFETKDADIAIAVLNGLLAL